VLLESPDRILAQLSKVLESRAFASAERMRRLLQFVVRESVRAPDEPLKEIVIGSELYNSSGDFDPRLSAVVRVDATRLRAKLREYYAAEGASDSLIIDLPKGSYTPAFHPASIQPRTGLDGAHDTSVGNVGMYPAPKITHAEQQSFFSITTFSKNLDAIIPFTNPANRPSMYNVFPCTIFQTGFTRSFLIGWRS
jgi:hypothetical protein